MPPAASKSVRLSYRFYDPPPSVRPTWLSSLVWLAEVELRFPCEMSSLLTDTFRWKLSNGMSSQVQSKWS